MTTRRTEHAAQPGPVDFGFDTNSLTCEIEVVTGLETAEITVWTEDDEGPSADLVKGFTPRRRGDLFEVELKYSGNGGTTIISGGGMTVIQSSGGMFFDGDVVVGRGVHMVNGRVVGGGRGVQVGSSPVFAKARLPIGSSISADLTSGSVSITGDGPLKRITAGLSSGNLTMDASKGLTVEEVSGSISSGNLTIAGVTRHADLNGSSGNITAIAAQVSPLPVLRGRVSSGNLMYHGFDPERSRAKASSGNARRF